MKPSKAFIISGVIGSLIGATLLLIDWLSPFAPKWTPIIENLTFTLCPFYLLGFTNLVHGMIMLSAISIVANFAIYGTIGCVLLYMIKLGKRFHR